MVKRAAASIVGLLASLGGTNALAGDEPLCMDDGAFPFVLIGLQFDEAPFGWSDESVYRPLIDAAARPALLTLARSGDLARDQREVVLVLIDEPLATSTQPDSASSSGGGATSWYAIAALLALATRVRLRGRRASRKPPTFCARVPLTAGTDTTRRTPGGRRYRRHFALTEDLSTCDSYPWWLACR